MAGKQTLGQLIRESGLNCIPEYELFALEVGPGKGLRQRLKDAGWKNYRYDFALPDHRLLIEAQGSGYSHSHRHNQQRDYRKNNDALKLGWRVMYFPANMISRYPQVVLDDILEVIKNENMGN